MIIYKTKTRQNLYNILSKSKNKLLTINEINEIIKTKKINVGITTIYRYLSELEKENKIIKQIRSNGEAEYQITDEECLKHIHIKCKKCGKFIHLDCVEFNQLNEHLMNKHELLIDLNLSNFIGTCEQCNKEEIQ